MKHLVSELAENLLGIRAAINVMWQEIGDMWEYLEELEARESDSGLFK